MPRQWGTTELIPDPSAAQNPATKNYVDTLITALLTSHGAGNTVATSETTTSATYVDLTTVGPSVTITSTGTLAVVLFTCLGFNATTPTNGAYMGVAVSGATTLAASDATALIQQASNTGSGVRAAGFAFLTITPGANTYRAKYRTLGTTATFTNRSMYVLAP